MQTCPEERAAECRQVAMPSLPPPRTGEPLAATVHANPMFGDPVEDDSEPEASPRCVIAALAYVRRSRLNTADRWSRPVKQDTPGYLSGRRSRAEAVNFANPLAPPARSCEQAPRFAPRSKPSRPLCSATRSRCTRACTPQTYGCWGVYNARVAQSAPTESALLPIASVCQCRLNLKV